MPDKTERNDVEPVVKELIRSCSQKIDDQQVDSDENDEIKAIKKQLKKHESMLREMKNTLDVILLNSGMV